MPLNATEFQMRMAGQSAHALAQAARHVQLGGADPAAAGAETTSTHEDDRTDRPAAGPETA
eukprot:CAMPEP_0179146976 /NCGR_PEP_ID=MMETSP0796-20121207/71021_1 /TAXON_ID=73915 /ORGANISM="Pyrodinium bahamense, Strain pbaha01" /LENGTH=60 /DNA_ID=CAMNT_0020847531 /DNA_START=37 /DNA_END=214 /DNA_ORIENTATION=+